MKNTHICSKCNGTYILRIEGQSKAYGTGNNIPVGMTIFSAVLVHRYLCCNCGFSEEWIAFVIWLLSLIIRALLKYLKTEEVRKEKAVVT